MVKHPPRVRALGFGVKLMNSLERRIKSIIIMGNNRINKTTSIWWNIVVGGDCIG